MGLILAVAGGVFLVALVLAGLALIDRGESVTQAPQPTLSSPIAEVTPTPVPTDIPAVTPQGILHVESQPTGANVMVNGEQRGKTPLDLTELPLGSYEVKVELRGHDAKIQSVDLTTEAPRGELKLTLSPKAPAMGVADILSTPFGAAVTMDGAAVGETPLTDFKVRLGNHKFDITKDGYEPFSATVKVEAGKRAKIDAQLKAIVREPPTPAPRSPEPVDPNAIYENVASQVDTLAQKISGSSPSYPDRAPRLRSGESVSVTVSFVVTQNGEVTDLRVVESAGSKIVDDAVTTAVREWKFSPAVKRGVKVKVRMTRIQTFKAG